VKLLYDQSREIVVRVYTERGYIGSTEIISILWKFDLIILDDRRKLMEVIVSLESHEMELTREKRLANKMKKG